MKTEKELQDFLFEKNHDAFSIAAAVQCAFRLLEKDTMFIADAVKVHLQHEILEFAKAYAQQRVKEAIRWIPVSERLPEEDGRYWCYVREVNDLGISYYQWNCAYSSNSVSKWSDNLRSKDVTHWQPLPKAPTV